MWAAAASLSAALGLINGFGGEPPEGLLGKEFACLAAEVFSLVAMYISATLRQEYPDAF